MSADNEAVVDEDYEAEEEEEFAQPVMMEGGPRYDVYTVLLILSAIFYGAALTVSIWELKFYSSDWLWNLPN